jgi:RNA polymerase sigma factor (sigma-70 family)
MTRVKAVTPPPRVVQIRGMPDVAAAVESAYRAHASALLAVLVRLFGTQNLALAEDVLQEAFRKALVAWADTGVPDSPAAWLMATAKHQALDTIRNQRTRRRFADDLSQQLDSGWTRTYAVEQEFGETRIKDHQLRMFFMCASADLTPDSRIPLMLRALCGFSIPAICRALVLPEATVKKRLLRSRERLAGHAFDFPPLGQLPQAMDTVHTVIYLLFNEGYHTTHGSAPMDLELCREAVHLATLLADEPRVVNQDTLGLVALMELHLARAASRLDDSGASVPLDLQDRARWDGEQIAHARALIAVAYAAPLGASGRFIIEARIAEQHCLARTFADTDWRAIRALYDQLVDATGSPIAELHRAVALGYEGDLQGAIARVEALRATDLLRSSHVPPAVLAHLWALAGSTEHARRLAAESTALGGADHEQRALLAQVERLLAAARP